MPQDILTSTQKSCETQKFGGNGGDAWNSKCNANEYIAVIELRYNQTKVRGMRIIYSYVNNGKASSVRELGKQEDTPKQIGFLATDLISEIICYKTEAEGGRVAGLSIKKAGANNPDVLGNITSNFVKYSFPIPAKLTGLIGNEGKDIDSLGFILNASPVSYHLSNIKYDLNTLNSTSLTTTPFGGNGGGDWNSQCNTDNYITKIELRFTADKARGVKVSYSNGTSNEAGALADDSQSIEFSANDLVSKVICYKNDAGDRFLGMNITKVNANGDSTITSCGHASSNWIEYVYPTPVKLVGLYGRSGSDLDSLGLMLADPVNMIGKLHIVNNGSSEQFYSNALTYTRKSQSMWENNDTLNVDMPINGDLSMLEMVNGQWSLSFAKTHAWQTRRSEQSEDTLSRILNVKVPPFSKIEVDVSTTSNYTVKYSGDLTGTYIDNTSTTNKISTTGTFTRIGANTLNVKVYPSEALNLTNAEKQASENSPLQVTLTDLSPVGTKLAFAPQQVAISADLIAPMDMLTTLNLFLQQTFDALPSDYKDEYKNKKDIVNGIIKSDNYSIAWALVSEGVRYYIFSHNKKISDEKTRKEILIAINDINFLKPEYYTTVQSVVIGEQIHLLIRATDGLRCYVYDKQNDSITQKNTHAFLSDSSDEQWKVKQHYSTIQSVVFNKALHVIAYGKTALYLWQYNANQNTWSTIASTAAISDSRGYDVDPQYYSTIHPVVVHNKPNDNLYVFARAGEGLYCFEYDQNNWVQSAPLGFASWGPSPSNYSMMKPVVIDNHIYIFGRSATDGLVGGRYDTAKKALVFINSLIDLADKNNKGNLDKIDWTKEEYYSTIQYLGVKGQLHVLARAPEGLRCYSYSKRVKKWHLENTLITLSDSAGWNNAEYYKTIQTEVYGDELRLIASKQSNNLAYRYTEFDGFITDESNNFSYESNDDVSIDPVNVEKNYQTTRGRSVYYFENSRNLHVGEFSIDVASNLKTLANVFENSEFLQARAFAPNNVAKEITEKGKYPDVGTDLKDLLTLDYARTDEGNSVYGAAAYFYDLLRVVLSQVRVGNPDKIDVKDAIFSLLERRPDLLDIRLDNEATTGLVIPTLAMVNYILARQLLKNEDSALLFASAGVTKKLNYSELMANYEQAAFDTIAKNKTDSAHWPFELDFESQQAYLKSMGKTMYELYDDVKKILKDENITTDVLAAYYLGLSRQVLNQLTHDMKAVDTQSGVKALCKAMHISYERLGELLHLNVNNDQERDYVNAMDQKNYYINVGASDSISLALNAEQRDESLQNLNDDRIKRIGVFHFLSQQLSLNCDELELVISVFKVNFPLTTSDIQALYLVKKLKDQLDLPITVIVSALIKNAEHHDLYTAVMESIRPISGTNNVWALHWNLLPAYLQALNDAESGYQTSFNSANVLLEQNRDLVGYQDIHDQFNAPKPVDYFLYYANQTLAYLVNLTGISIEELGQIYTVIQSKKDASDELIRKVYMFGQLKKYYQRSLVELCQLACYLSLQNMDTVSFISNEEIIAKGINVIDTLFTENNQQEILDQLVSLHETNQLATSQKWNLDDLMFIRFNIAPDVQQQQVGTIRQGLSDGFFTKLIVPAEGQGKPSLNLSLNDEKFLTSLESNVAGLFDLDSAIFHRIMMIMNTEQVNRFYSTLIIDQAATTISFMQRCATIVSFFKLKKTPNDQLIAAKKDVQASTNNSSITLKQGFDDIELLIHNAVLALGQARGDFYFAVSNAQINTLVAYKKSQAILAGSFDNSLTYFLKGELDINKLVLRLLKINPSDWSVLKNLVFVDKKPESIYDKVDYLDRFTQLKTLLDFFNNDTQLVIAFLQKKDPQFISQHLSQVLQTKNSKAYDLAVQNLNERKRDVLVESVLRMFHNDSAYVDFKLDNADKLSTYLLTDVSITGEDLSSPIVQAHGTLQWYLRRCMEGMEQDEYSVNMDIHVPDSWWSWIENFRVWQANRQVFLYPENFLSPDLRITQSAEFKQLSKSLRKPNLDTEAISQAYLQYVTDIMKLRGVVIVTACAGVLISQAGGYVQTIHVFGTDNASPKQLYHCTVEQLLDTDQQVLAYQNWTFWEKLSLSIPSDATSLRAIFAHNRPNLYWVQSTEVTSPTAVSITDDKSAKVDNSKTEIQNHLYGSYQHADGNWQAAQLLDDTLDYQQYIKTGLFDNNIFRVFKIDIYGKHHAQGAFDENESSDGLVFLNDQKKINGYYFPIPADLNTLLSNMSTILVTRPLEAIFEVNQSALKSVKADDLWGQYYWELMHFAPLTLADALQTTQQFDTALTWYKGIFNPSLRSKKLTAFVFSPFTVATGNDILSALLNTQYLNDLHMHAFESHRMATLRGSLPYKKYVVMQYVRNLIAWGDSLFTDNTRESINEAMSRYLAASDLLGDTPRDLYSARYDDALQHSTLDELMSLSFSSTQDVYAPPATSALMIYPYNYVQASYFKVPENREFMALWSNVADRIYKIRHCLSISGVKQQLALFSPPIDPHQLVSAVATRGGEFVRDMLDEISGKNRPHYRFLVLLDRAKEFAGFVERLGDSLMSILERQDNAGLVVLHNNQALEMLDLMTRIREKSLKQAQDDEKSLAVREASIQARIDYYKKMLGFKGGMRPEEQSAEKLLHKLAVKDTVIQSIGMAAQIAGAVPEVGSPFAMTFGGRELLHVAASAAGATAISNVMMQYNAGSLERTAGFNSKVDDWKLQLTLAQKEMEELTKYQKPAAALRVEVAQMELENHNTSIKQQQAVTNYNNTQFTNVDLYAWLADQIYELYNNAFQLAVRVSNQAAYAYRYELGLSTSFEPNNFWAASRKGLSAGPKLTQQLHQMQQDYLDNNARVPEIEKVISLRDLYCQQKTKKTWGDAIADLKGDGISFQLPLSLFDDFSKVESDKPRKIKMISVSVPALTGPNQQVNLVLGRNNNEEQICISKGIASTGMFSPNFDDARYLPFEGKEFDSTTNWKLWLGGNVKDLDEVYDSITDIQLRVCYIIQKNAPSITPQVKSTI